MEENERRNVEVQINRLKNIQVLLNTAVIEMEQYSAVVSQLDSPKSRNQTNSTNVITTVLANNKYVNTEPTMAKSFPIKSGEKPNLVNFKNPKSPLLSNEGTGAYPKIKSQQDTANKRNDDNINEMRKRRFEKFGSTPAISE